jgi:hypothetical protein
VFVRPVVDTESKMQNLEALYVAEFGDVAALDIENGGGAVLETNRISGCNGGYHYIGDYSIFGGPKASSE